MKPNPASVLAEDLEWRESSESGGVVDFALPFPLPLSPGIIGPSGSTGVGLARTDSKRRATVMTRERRIFKETRIKSQVG